MNHVHLFTFVSSLFYNLKVKAFFQSHWLDLSCQIQDFFCDLRKMSFKAYKIISTLRYNIIPYCFSSVPDGTYFRVAFLYSLVTFNYRSKLHKKYFYSFIIGEYFAALSILLSVISIHAKFSSFLISAACRNLLVYRLNQGGSVSWNKKYFDILILLIKLANKCTIAG